ncbi:hypothetical protein GW17_00017254 [Ensete ventricosum]|uniref:Uncharacterized protein n=1 Tax=Ensete ventricosum TaxID=4639 RepID=A0A427AP14_ENSVE|nr:hypothetical protein B296_00008354 [Ensete ventricosum]RWW18739.1 hypothetical protein GW17_00017254 [Ensete ventricosum]
MSKHYKEPYLSRQVATSVHIIFSFCKIRFRCRTVLLISGMQSSLLALALANKFFKDPLVGVPPAISVSSLDVSDGFCSGDDMVQWEATSTAS